MNFAEHGTELHVAAGRRVLLDGPFSQALVLVTAGRGRIRCAGEAGAELGPGDLFGELAPRRQAYETATVTAVCDLMLIGFSSRQVKLMGQVAPEAVAQLLGHGHGHAAFRATAAA